MNAVLTGNKLLGTAVVTGIIVALFLFVSATLTSAATDDHSGEPEYMNAVREMAHGDSAQLASLADGVVSPDEHTAAYAKYLQCLQDAGFTIVRLDEGKGLRRSNAVIATPGEFTQQAVSEAHNRSSKCRGTHLDAVDTAFALQLPVLDDDQVAELRIRLEACVKAGGVQGLSTQDQQFSGDHRAEIAVESLEAYSQCARTEQENNGVLSPAPITK